MEHAQTPVFEPYRDSIQPAVIERPVAMFHCLFQVGPPDANNHGLETRFYMGHLGVSNWGRAARSEERGAWSVERGA